MKLWVLFSLMASACMGAEIRSMTPVPQSTNTNGWWWGRLRQKDAAVADGGSRIVFLGDSITHGWEAEGRFWWNKYFAGEPYRALNLGYAGDATENVIWRMENGQLEGYRARRFVVKAGHHNSRFDSRSDKAKAVERIVELIKLRHKESRVEVEN